MIEPTTPALEVVDLELAYRVRGVDRRVLRGVSFTIAIALAVVSPTITPPIRPGPAAAATAESCL